MVYGGVYRTEVVECVCSPLSALQLFCWVISVETHRVFSKSWTVDIVAVLTESESVFFYSDRRNPGAKELTWRTRWSGTSASGLWRWRRTVRGNCAWSSHSRASRTPPADTRTWIHQQGDSRTCRRSYTRRVYTCRTMHLLHSAHLEEKDKLFFSIILVESTRYSWMDLKQSAFNIISLRSYQLNEVIVTLQFIILSLPWRFLIHGRLKYGFIGSISYSESSFTKMPLMIGHADIQMYVLGPWIKH